jgi:hypothetical protein
MHKHPAIVLQYGTGNVLVMKCPQHGKHLVLGHLSALVAPCHLEVSEAAELLKALEAGGNYGGLARGPDTKPDHRVSFHRVSGGEWGLQVIDDEPDVTWFVFAAPYPAPSADPVALNREGRQKLRAAVMETLYGKEAKA